MIATSEDEGTMTITAQASTVKRTGRALLLAGGLLAAALGGAAAGPRVALLIGNGDYEGGVPSLANAVNDARTMERTLKAAGFETILAVNTTRRQINAAIADFTGRLYPGTVGLLYYAGHGIQANGHNYLIPVDAEIDSEAELPSEAYDLSRALQGMDDAHDAMNILILDACRDNPLPKTRSIARGLARVDAPRGTFIAYAAGPGQTALDGPKGGNGVFTGELVKVLDEPGLKIEDVFKKVTQNVLADTKNKQSPWTESSIEADFFFHTPVGVPEPVPVLAALPAAPVVTAVPVAAAPAPVADKSIELAFWSAVKDSNDPADYQAYLRKYPEGDFAELARNHLERAKPPAVAEPVAAPSPVKTAAAPEAELEPLDQTMVAIHTASLRALPELRAEEVGRLKTGEAVKVAGRVKGKAWYAVEREDGTAYVATSALEDQEKYAARKGAPQKIAHAKAPPPAPGAPVTPRPSTTVNVNVQPSPGGSTANAVGQTARQGAIAVAQTAASFFHGLSQR